MIGGLLFTFLFWSFTRADQSSQYLKITDNPFQKQHQQFLNAKEIAPGCVFVSYNPPSLITTINRECVNISYLFNNKVYDGRLKTRCLILVNDFFCRQNRDGFCGDAKNKYVVERVKSKYHADLGIFYYLKNPGPPDRRTSRKSICIYNSMSRNNPAISGR